MKRQPMVVSKISAERENASGALPITNGARVIDSTPPAIAKSISPARIARPAAPTASSPEAQRRLSVAPGTDLRQARQQQRHPRHVAVVLAGLVGAAEIDLVDRGPVELGMPRHQGLDRGGRQIVGAHFGERAAEAADRGPHGIANKYIAH